MCFLNSFWARAKRAADRELQLLSISFVFSNRCNLGVKTQIITLQWLCEQNSTATTPHLLPSTCYKDLNKIPATLLHLEVQIYWVHI